MPTLAEVRQQYPQYQDMPDQALAGALYSKFYSDMPRGEFDKKIGYSGPLSVPDIAGQAWQDLKKAVSGVASSVYSGVTLPRDVITGDAKLPSSEGVPGSVEFGSPESSGQRVADTAFLATPLPAAMRAGERAIPGVAKATRPAEIPTTEAIQEAATAGFNSAKNMGVDVSTRPIVELANKVERQLWEKGIHEEHAPTTYATLNRLKSPPARAATDVSDPFVTISDLHNIRQAFGNAGGNIAHPKDTLAGSMAKNALDDFLKAIPEKDIFAGNATAASRTLKEAIDNSAAAFRAADVDARLTRAERQAAKAGSGSNIDNAIRQKISAVLDVQGRTRGWTPQEIAQAEAVVRGTGTANAARKLGKLGFNDGLTLALHSGAVLGGQGAVSIPLGIAGTISRKIAETLTKREATKLDTMLRSRSPLAQKQQGMTQELSGSQQAMRAALIRALGETNAQPVQQRRNRAIARALSQRQ